MTADSRFDRDLTTLVESLYLGPSPDYRDEVLATAVRSRQRPSWTFAGRWLPMAEIATATAVVPHVRWRAIGAAIVIVALLAAALAIVAGSRQTRLPPPFGPARNGLIVYPTGGDVYALDPVTGHTTALVTGQSGDLDALYSPDGSRLAFSRLSMTGDPVLLSIIAGNADGSNLHVVTSHPLAADGLRFEWAPDSRSIYVQTGQHEILLVDTTMSSKPRILTTDAELLQQAARPPDGTELLIRRTQGTWHRLIALNVATGGERPIAEGGGDAIRSARWSTSGEQVAYATTVPDDPASTRLWVVNADGSNRHPVTHAAGTWANEDPAWSPDDRQIAFTQYEQTSKDPVTWDIRRIGIVDVTSGAMKSVGPLSRDVRKQFPTDHDSGASPTERFAFDWSPDGKTILAVPSTASGHPVVIDPSKNTWTVLDTIFDQQGGASQLWQRTAP